MDIERVRKNEHDLPTQIVWESQQLKQKISYVYDINNNLSEEYIIQLNKITNTIKSIYCKHYTDYCSIVTVDGNNVEYEECGK